MALSTADLPRRTAQSRAQQVDDWRDRSRRLSELASKLNARGDVDDAILVLDAALDYRRRATAEVNSWPESQRTA